METAFGVGVALIVVQSISVPLNYLLHAHVLSAGALGWAGLPDVDLGFMRLITFIGIVAAMVQIIEMLLDRYVPALYSAWHLPTASRHQLRHHRRQPVHGRAAI